MRARALLSALPLLAACPVEEVDLCAPDDAPTVTLGDGVGGAFLAYEDEQEVGLTIAPQGGFGVNTLIATTGVEAGENVRVSALLQTFIEGEEPGEFLLEGALLPCRGPETGGLISGVVVGFDRDRYRSNDDLLSLDGRVIDLAVTVTSPDGSEVDVRQPVTVRVGG